MTKNLMDELMNDLPYDTCPKCRRLYTTEEVQKYGFGSGLCPDCQKTGEISKAAALEIAQAAKPEIEQFEPETHGDGWCDKCHSYCYGDCTAN